MKNKSIKILILFLLVIIVITGCEDKHINEWATKSDKQYYYDKTGNKVKNVLKEINGNKYYFNNKGEMCTGFVKIDDDLYYFDDNGKTLSGKIKINDDYYYLNDDGKVLTGWQEIDGNNYHFDTDGKMSIGIVKIGGKKFYFDENGLPSHGWVKNQGDYYFLDDNSTVLTGLQKDGTDWYYLDDNGIMQKSRWIETESNIYYADANGKIKLNTAERIKTIENTNVNSIINSNNIETIKKEVSKKEKLELVGGIKGTNTEGTSFLTYIKGTIKNNTEKNYSYVQISFTLYDSDGATVGTALANIAGLEAGGLWKFKAIALEDFSKYKLGEITGW